MHFERNNWQFKPISKKMEKSSMVREDLHTEGQIKKVKSSLKKMWLCTFSKGANEEKWMYVGAFCELPNKCLCLFCDFNILFVCTWLQIFPPRPIFYDSIKLVTYHQNCIKKLGYMHRSKNTQTNSNPSQN